MDDKSWITALSQARVTAELARQRFDVYVELVGKAPFDLIAHKEGLLYRVSVKSTMSTKCESGHSWEVQLKRVRSNKTGNAIHKFDPDSCDILAIYIEQIDKVCFFNPKEINCTSSITIRENATSMAKNCWVVDEHLRVWV
ncbi:group I intron-associated PD-(D/E)XK endonuclease [Paenibacillus sp.]|uniref:group I intron-associated PD-(D/E)XK endonuclease n=1 Tax=Paenibacillus sp. TaxID=58172 RepID=UPI0039C8C603